MRGVVFEMQNTIHIHQCKFRLRQLRQIRFINGTVIHYGAPSQATDILMWQTAKVIHQFLQSCVVSFNTLATIAVRPEFGLFANQGENFFIGGQAHLQNRCIARDFHR